MVLKRLLELVSDKNSRTSPVQIHTQKRLAQIYCSFMLELDEIGEASGSWS